MTPMQKLIWPAAERAYGRDGRGFQVLARDGKNEVQSVRDLIVLGVLE